ncbi:MAG: hypothetical protein Q8N60_03105, partial [Candidatus Diapherotrites archaeon]|nr:hypothetical protein [Candidatus Diapherotrites archaeon]
MGETKYDFMSQITSVFGSGQSRSVALTGNIHDLFFSPFSQSSSDGAYKPLLEYLLTRWMKDTKFIKIVYEFNQPVKFIDAED